MCGGSVGYRREALYIDVMSDSPKLDAILAELANGVIDTAEASRRIAALNQRSDEPAALTGAEGLDPIPELTGSGGIRSVTITATGQRVRVIGDEAVSTATVSGQHTMRRNADGLVITATGRLGPSIRGFSPINPPRTASDLKQLGLGPALEVRVNPHIQVNAQLSGGSLQSQDVPHWGRVRVSAGVTHLRGVAQLNDGLFQAGTATINGPISLGLNTLRVESGSLAVELTERADVGLSATSQLGVVRWPGEKGNRFDEYLVGRGLARMELSGVMSRIVVRDLVAFPEEADRPTAGDRLRGGARVVVTKVREVQAARASGVEDAAGSEGPSGDEKG
ncbi:Uncharacterised protein [Propionibacterium australiense]|uniref:Uncharacterized protein n=2 Tax=Propionibacterium australiense TaxID=119981 RepID=A0A383S9W0_9ACTN|nr:Hypothetical protein PROPAUS_2208 [Propionibacterium australiense]VEH89467.1 Uncharacterised protein [Propionibacterium australiense]